MRHKIKVYLLLLVVTFCTFFDTSNTRAESSYLGEISYGAWELGTTGSAKYLDGSTVFVCIFLEDMGASWTEEEKQQVEDNLEVACDFLVEEGEHLLVFVYLGILLILGNSLAVVIGVIILLGLG